MFGPPKDVDGQCNAHLYIGDDYGDNHATMRCQLPKGHDGDHQETFRNGKAKVTWSEDERTSDDFDGTSDPHEGPKDCTGRTLT